MKGKIIILLLFILIIASFFRLWQLDSIPPGLYPDEAIHGNEAIQALKTKDFKIFYPENNGREGLFINLIAFSFLIFGISIWSIKIVSAIIGILTILGLYLLVKEIFESVKLKGSELVALFSSFFLAISFWHVNFSRIGFRAIFVPFVLSFSFYFLFKGFRTKKLLNFIASGIIFGLGFHTYISFRLAVLLIMVVLFLWWLAYRKQKEQRKYLLLVSCFLLFMFIVALPIGIYFLNNPQNFVSRATGVSVFAQPNSIKSFVESSIIHLGMFNFQGDNNWRHNIPNYPILFWPIGILFLIGFLFSTKELIISIIKKNHFLLTVHCSLISWFFIMLLPGALTYEGIPHSLRCIGAIPPVFIFAALGINFLYQKLKLIPNMSRKTSRINWVAVSGTILLLSSLIFVQYLRYFKLWGENPEVKGAFTRRFVETGKYLNSFPEETQKYVIVNESGVPVPYPQGIPVSAQTIMFIESTKFGSPQSTYLLPEDLDQIKINDKKTVIAPMKYDKGLFEELNKKFPQGEIGIQIENNIWIYIINF